MNERLHRLIDSRAPQPVINERVATIVTELVHVGTDHEKRIRFLERTVNYSLGAIGMLAVIFEGLRLAHELFK